MNISENLEQPSESDVAIIGLAGRFPGARDVEQFWLNLRDGVESVSFFSDEELLSAGVNRSLLARAEYVKAAAVLDDVELFDAVYFGFNPREAEIMDPQHRVFLECALEALENAGYDAENHGGAIGVYAGGSLSTYLMNIYANRDLTKHVSGFQILIANDKDYLPTRVSYKLNLMGPSVSIQTSCSTSLVSVHMACESLLNGVCDMALAGGVSIKVPQKTGYLYQEGGINSPDGHCRAFDAGAAGTIGGGGVGIVVLKRLRDALTDRDHVHAVIKGSAINNDGALKVGYTAPGIEGQAKVIEEALSIAGVEPETISYVEAHGTGTTLGDPIEIAALTKAFRRRTEKKNFCAVGSVKTNVGHLDAAAGVTGLIKTVLALEHRMIPPSLHFAEPNPKIDFANSPFYVNAGLREWKGGPAPRRAGISSFGIGGTNAHVIVEEAPAPEASGDSRPWQLLLLSAKTGSALETATTNLAAYLRQHREVRLADVAFTLQVGRKAHDHRRLLLCRDVSEALDALESCDEKRLLTGVQQQHTRPVCFMFSGQGSQHANMARELYQSESTFRGVVDRCAEFLVPHLGVDLRQLLYQRAGDAAGADSARLKQTFFAQAAVFVIEYALTQQWMEWGVRPAAMIGHSIGEYAAACIAGVMSPDEALALVAARGRLMQRVPAGAMLAVQLGEREVEPLLGPQLSLAAVNGARLLALSGTLAAVEELERRLDEKGIGYRRLHTSHAFHSEMMEPILSEFLGEVSKVNLKPPRIPYLSNLSGTWVTEAEATDAGYWARHLRQTVRFADGLTELLKEPSYVLLEVGPGQTLATLAKHHPATNAQQSILSSLPHPSAPQSVHSHFINTLGQLWLAGVKVNWAGFWGQEQRRRLPLPTYPFERQRYWIEGPQVAPAPENDSLLPVDLPSQAAIAPASLQSATETTPLPHAPPTEVNGKGQSLTGQGLHGPNDARHRVVARQLQLMSRHLELLRESRLA